MAKIAAGKKLKRSRNFRMSDQQWAEIERAAALEGIDKAEIIRAGSLAEARKIIRRHGGKS